MTPFGAHIRQLRQRRGVALVDMAAALGVSSAYLSALEHGHRGRPSAGLVQQICAFFNLAWEEVDQLKHLAEISSPKCTIDTAGLSPKATEAANLLAARIPNLTDQQLDDLLAYLRKAVK